MSAVFAEWQPRYAKHHVATFPVEISDAGKVPKTKGYLKTGLQGSAQLAMKFPEALSFGFACGRYNRVTIVDMDSPDPAIIPEAERLFGASPIIWRTGSGKFAMPFRHNGEPRRIRPLGSVPIDVLGAGFAVAPPSAGAVQPYEIIKGSLAALDRLPVAKMPDEIARSVAIACAAASERVPKGRRNAELFRYCPIRGFALRHARPIDRGGPMLG